MDATKVAAAILVRDGKVFAARRETSENGPGWEFPGGKVAQGETPEDALRREVTEELGITLTTMLFYDTVEHAYPTFTMSMDCYICPVPSTCEPTLTEHAEGRWLGREDLLSVDWLAADERVAMSLGAFWDVTFASEHY